MPFKFIRKNICDNITNMYFTDDWSWTDIAPNSLAWSSSQEALIGLQNYLRKVYGNQEKIDKKYTLNHMIKEKIELEFV